jgi:hypothetical protein
VSRIPFLRLDDEKADLRHDHNKIRISVPDNWLKVDNAVVGSRCSASKKRFSPALLRLTSDRVSFQPLLWLLLNRKPVEANKHAFRIALAAILLFYSRTLKS